MTYTYNQYNKPFRLYTDRYSKDSRAIVHEETDKHLNDVALAIYSFILINDIACQAVVDLKSSLQKPEGLFRQGVKHKFNILEKKMIGYAHNFNILTGDDIDDVIEWEDNFLESVEDSYKMMLQAYKNEMLRAKLPHPYTLAQLLYTRDCIYLGIGNYRSWIDYLKKMSPMMMARIDLSSRSIEDWEQAYINLSNEICHALHIDKGYDIKTDQIDLAVKIVMQKVCDVDNIAKALGMVKTENTI